METCAVIADDYGKSLLSEIKTLEKFVRSGPASDILKPMKMLHDLARFYIGGSVLDELLTDNFTNEQIWQQLKIATSSVEKTFENASVGIQKKRKRTDDATEEGIEKKLCTSETNDKTEDASDAESDDELKKITDRWNIDGRQLEDDDEDDDDDDEDDDEEEDDKAEKDDEDEEDDPKEDVDVSDGESPLDTLKKALKSKKKKTSVVDDKFFNLEDMHSFLDQQDRLANREVSEEADEDDDGNYMFRNISSDEDEGDEKNAKYSEFFDDLEEKNAAKGDKNDDEDEDNDDEAMDRDSNEENGKDEDEASESDSHEYEDDDNDEEDMEQDDVVDDDVDQYKENKLNKVGKTDNEPKSAFQKKQELMKKQITDVEESNLAEKPWHLRGEITAADRPENSLLTTHLDYKFNSAPTLDDDNKDVLSIEDLLRKYYDSDAFVVNVTRKVKPVGTTVKYRKDIVLDHEKSKLGLAEVLERDYLGQTQTRNQKEEDEYKENRKILNNLLLGLQMMFSNTPVTVMPPKMDLQIVENVPAIVVEEVAPVFVSDATRLTAEEVQGKRKGELVGATEKTKTNKKRERRLKKKFQHQKAMQKKVRALDPNSKEAHEEAQKQLERKSKRGKHITIHETDKKKKKLSSKDFFNQLQNQVTSHMDKKKEGLDKQKRKKNKKEQS